MFSLSSHRRVEPTCPTSKLLRKGDILLQFDDTEIGVDGTVAFRSGERINFSYLISEKQNNDKVRIWKSPNAVCSVLNEVAGEQSSWARLPH